MAFRFRFENVLKYRENIEKQKSVEFLDAEKAYIRQKKKVEKLIGEREELFSLMKELSSSFDFDLVTFNMIREFALKIEEDIRFEKDVLFQLKKVMEEKRRELIKASQDKRIMEKLKEKDYSAYLREENRKEVIELDEIASKTYNKKLRNI